MCMCEIPNVSNNITQLYTQHIPVVITLRSKNSCCAVVGYWLTIG